MESGKITAAADDAAASSIPRSSISIDISLPLPQMKPHIIELCKDLFKKWSGLDSFCFSIDTVSGGITNQLLKVSVREADGNEVSLTVRLYGPNTDLVIDREREMKALPHLSAAGFGAELLGLFENGMVQSFINARTLCPVAEELTFDDEEKQAKYESISFKEIHEEVNDLKKLADLLKAPVVFSHNDLLSGNLMLNEKEDKLYFIDFEYGSYSYRGYDIANHFNEYAGYECDYNLYPDKNAQYHFFVHYLQGDETNEVSEKDLGELYVETSTFRLVSHVYWALWALIQAKMSPIDFDYLGYFFLRYNEYKKHKEPCLSLARKQLFESYSN